MKTAPSSIRIGILDADLGGLRLMRAIQARWPGVGLDYLADTAHSPIGKRSPALIRRRLGLGLDFLTSQGANPLIIASQTMAALDVDEPSAENGPPRINPVRLAAVVAAETSLKGRIGVIASQATVDSNAYPRLISACRPAAAVHSAAAALLVPLLDEGRENKPEGRMILKKYLHRLKVRQVDTLIAGTSRCGQIEDLIGRKIGQRVRLIDPLACALQDLARQLAVAGPGPAVDAVCHCRLWVTDATPAVAAIARRILKRPTDFIEVRI